MMVPSTPEPLRAEDAWNERSFRPVLSGRRMPVTTVPSTVSRLRTRAVRLADLCAPAPTDARVSLAHEFRVSRARRVSSVPRRCHVRVAGTVVVLSPTAR